jgi:phosphoribosyl-AMP cyclohydrolase
MMAQDIAPQGRPGEVAELLHWNSDGLVMALAQDRVSGEILMAAWADREALLHTLTSGLATFHSRSRGRRWTKGEESGHVLRVREVRTDCDGDAVLYLVDPAGPACHQGRSSCFSHRIDRDGSVHTDRPVIA